MRNLMFLNNFRRDFMGCRGDSGNGFFVIPNKNNGYYQVIASNGCGWDHVSVCLLDKKFNFVKRTLKWDEMCEIKNIFFKIDEQVVEFHPREQDYINEHSFVLHLWRSNVAEFPLPTIEDYTSTENIQKILLPRKNIFFKIPNGFYSITTIQTNEWIRVRVSLLDKYKKPLDRFPSWDEMCNIKQMLFQPEEAVIEIHPDKRLEIGDCDYTIDLWKPLNREIPLPPSKLVGMVKKYPNK